MQRHDGSQLLVQLPNNDRDSTPLRLATYTFRFFEAEEVQVAVFVAGDDDLESIGECAATRSVITGEGDQACAAIYLPTLPAYCQTTQITRQSK